jgi:hypothetical protein
MIPGGIKGRETATKTAAKTADSVPDALKAR